MLVVEAFMWLRIQIAVTKLLLSLLLPVAEWLTAYASGLHTAAKQEARLPEPDLFVAPVVPVEKFTTNCAVCNYAWKTAAGIVLSEIECPNCGAQAAMLGVEV